jgi:hypothetical protein
MVFFLPSNIAFFLVGFSLFSVVFVGGALCVYPFITLVYIFCLFWVCWVSGSFSGGPGQIFLLCVAPLCGVSGRYSLFECWPGVGGGAVRIFFFSHGLC